MKKLLLSFGLLATCSIFVQGQQVIGEFPTMDGGFENQTPSNPLSTISSTGDRSFVNWSIGSSSNAGTKKVEAGTARTGVNFGSQSMAATKDNSRLQAPSNPSTNYLQASTEYIIQFYYRTDSNPTDYLKGAIYLNGTSNSANAAASSTIPDPFTPNVWIRYAEAVTTNSTGTTTATTASTAGPGNYACMRLGGAADGFLSDVDIDDFVVYAGSTPDTSAPNAATVGTYNTNGTIGWTAATGGVDGGGYVVVKYASMPAANDDLNQNGIYQVDNTVVGTVSGTVVYIGTATTFNDTYATGTYYKIYAVDKAFNYSDEIVISDASLSLSKNEIEGLKVYPNPVKDYLTIESDKTKISSVEIYNVLGSKVLSNNTLVNNKLNVSSLTKGVYVLKINADASVSTRKIVID